MASHSLGHHSIAFALSSLMAFACAADRRTVLPEVRNVLIVTIDTTRADVLSAYGANRVETPALDRLAREGVVFEQATSTVPLTLPAHCSLFTGLFPPHHGVRDNAAAALAEAPTTLAEALHAQGFRSGAFVGSAIVDARRGLDQGFDAYSDGQRENRNPKLRRPANVVVDEAVEWMTRQDASPFFAWVHLYDAHAPYSLPEPYRTMYEDVPYLGAIAFIDAQLARLLKVVDQRRLAGRTLVVVVADHGESLGEHGEDSHGIFLYQSTLQVPMIVRAPGLVPHRVSDVVRIVDIMPTVLDFVRVSPPAMDGVSLLPLMTGKVEHVDLDAYSESLYPRRFGWGELHALRAGRFKFVSAPRPELYDLEKDPTEQRNIYRQRTDLAAMMRATLERMSQSAAVVHDSDDLDPEAAERLASLGYVGQTRGVRHDSPGEWLDDPKDCISAYNTILRNNRTSPLQFSPALPAGHGNDAGFRPPSVPVLNAASASSRPSFEHRLSCSAAPSALPRLSELRASALERVAPRTRMPPGASR